MILTFLFDEKVGNDLVEECSGIHLLEIRAKYTAMQQFVFETLFYGQV